MRKFTTAAIATAFATLGSLAILASGAQQPARSNQAFLSAAPSFALADRDDNQDRDDNNRNCTNPAGNERGWCKHHRGGSNAYSGTVQSINGNTVYFLRNNGQPLTFIDNNGTRLYVGQRITVRLYNLNGTLALAPYSNGYNNGGYNGGYNNGQANRTVSGVILAVSGATLTFINGTSIDIGPAQQRGAINGRLGAGRAITAYGFVDGGNVFHATSIQ